MRNQNFQPALTSTNLFNHKTINGTYRLAGCLLQLDRNNKPYWKLQFSDVFGTICMYMFSQPDAIENLGHGAFIEVNGVIKKFNGRSYIEVQNLQKVNYDQVSDQIALMNLPNFYCAKQADLFRLHQLLMIIQSKSLLHFIANVIVPIDICIPFFQAPASLNHHHNFYGGLLAHTVEVAEIVSTLPFKTQVEKDLAITGAILHDIGKIKSLSGQMKRLETGKWVDHSDLTLEICSAALSNLERQNSLFANMLRHIWTCATPGSRYGYKSLTPVAESVQLADRFSAMSYRKTG